VRVCVCVYVCVCGGGGGGGGDGGDGGGAGAGGGGGVIVLRGKGKVLLGSGGLATLGAVSGFWQKSIPVSGPTMAWLQHLVSSEVELASLP
jgi:hypothetical protein